MFFCFFYPQFTDKLEDMLETLTMTAETVQNTESISAHPDKIRQQIEENKVTTSALTLIGCQNAII